MISPSKLNVIANYLNFAVMALVGLVVNPLLLGFLGAGSFGIWKACQRFLDFATVADGRATQALKWIVAYRAGSATVEDNRRDVGATLVVWLIWLPLLLLITAGITIALPSLIRDLDADSEAIVRAVGLILSANIVLTGLLSIPDSILVGTNQGYRSMFVTTLVFVLSNVLMLLLTWQGQGIVTLGFVVLGASIVNGGLTWLVARSKVPWLGIMKPNREDVGKLAKFSGWVLTWSFVTKLLLSTELVLLSALVGAVAVANYTFTSYVGQFAVSIAFMTTSAFMPKLGTLIGKKDMAAARVVVAETREINLAIITIAGAGILLFNRQFVSIWAGAQHYMGDSVNALLVIAFVQLSLIRWGAQVQDTGLVIRNKVLLGLAGAVLSVVAAAAIFALTHSIEWMYVGMIAGRLVLSVVFPVLVNRLIDAAPFAISPAGIRGYVVMVLVLIASFVLGPRIEVNNIFTLAVIAALATGVVALIAYFAILSRTTRAKIFSLPGRKAGAKA